MEKIMNIRFDMYIPPKELMEVSCTNCAFSKLQTYCDEKGNIIEINPLCTIVYKLVTDTDAQHCEAYESAHFESKRTQNYRKLT